MNDFSLIRFIPIWRRHFLAWKKYWLSSLMFSTAEPLIYMIGFGYGLGALVPELGGMSYIVFVASGSLAFSAQNGATFEGMYSAFSRMFIQRTWDAIINAPMSLFDVMMSEWTIAASKAVLSSATFVAALVVLGISREWTLIWVIPVALLIGLAFAALALIMTSVAKGYEFFSYWFSLGVLPMAMISGVFFPVEQLPHWVQFIGDCLPLKHGVELVRPLVQGTLPSNALLHVGVLLIYAIGGFAIAATLIRRRFAN
jgi:lipooligosaccharide transport system permease protein